MTAVFCGMSIDINNRNLDSFLLPNHVHALYCSNPSIPYLTNKKILERFLILQRAIWLDTGLLDQALNRVCTKSLFILLC